MRPRARLLSSTTVYNGKVVRLRLDQVIEPGGVRTTREVVSHGGSVVVLPHLPDGRVLLVRQFRYATRRSLWELVAGGIEPGENPRDAAQRELLEETGYHARTLKPLLNFYPSPGFLSERMHLVEARRLRPSKSQPEADERIQLGRFTRAQLRKMLRAKEIEDGKTLVGLLWLFGFSNSKTRLEARSHTALRAIFS